jgi:hypothetical protein
VGIVTPPSFAELQATYEKMAARRLIELQDRFAKLTTLRQRCDDELLILADEIENFGLPTTRRRRSRYQPAECGTESGYQAHRKTGDTCDECKAAHNEHERIESARRRLRKLAASA